jgi:hypothetical protein
MENKRVVAYFKGILSLFVGKVREKQCKTSATKRLQCFDRDLSPDSIDVTTVLAYLSITLVCREVVTLHSATARAVPDVSGSEGIVPLIFNLVSRQENDHLTPQPLPLCGGFSGRRSLSGPGSGTGWQSNLTSCSPLRKHCTDSATTITYSSTDLVTQALI